jgi:hypothetical protein
MGSRNANLGVVPDANYARRDQPLARMFETYRMLGRDREVELERIARAARGPRITRGSARERRPVRQRRSLADAWQLALARLTAPTR